MHLKVIPSEGQRTGVLIYQSLPIIDLGVIPGCNRIISSCKDVHVLIPGNCEDGTLYGKMEFAEVIKLWTLTQ